MGGYIVSIRTMLIIVSYALLHTFVGELLYILIHDMETTIGVYQGGWQMIMVKDFSHFIIKRTIRTLTILACLGGIILLAGWWFELLFTFN